MIFIFSVKYFYGKKKSDIVILLRQTQITKDSCIYFIGSSRVQNAVNIRLIADSIHSSHIFNLGCSGANFFSNCLLAEFLMQNKSPKKLFIELGLIKNNFPKHFAFVAEEADMNLYSLTEKLFSNQFFFDRQKQKYSLLEEYTNNNLNFDADKLMQTLHLKKIEQHWGFVAKKKTDFQSTNSFLTEEEIYKKEFQSSQTTQYELFILSLLKSAKESNTKIIFMLPLTCEDQDEKQAIIPFYRTLPDSFKFVFTKKFMNEISDSKYLFNANHLNEDGAKVYSEMISDYLKQTKKCK